ncbi:hypothetical protein Tco_1033595 [Tanacetum coccineum]
MVYRKILEDRTRRLSEEFEFVKLLAEINHEFGFVNSSQDEQDVSNDVDIDDVVFDDVSFDVVDFDVVMDDLDLNRSRRDDKGNDNPYHNVDEPEEINDMFADLDQAFDEIHLVIEAQDVSDLFVVYDQLMMKKMLENGDVISTKVYDVMVAQEMLKDQAGDVISVEVVSKDMVAEETVVGSSGKDKDVVIPHEVYAAMVVIEGFLYSQDRDVVNLTEV